MRWVDMGGQEDCADGELSCPRWWLLSCMNDLKTGTVPLCLHDLVQESLPYPGPGIPGFSEQAPEISTTGFEGTHRLLLKYDIACAGSVASDQLRPKQTSHLIVNQFDFQKENGKQKLVKER